MDFDLKQWRSHHNQDESEPKVPRLVLDLHSTTAGAAIDGGGGGVEGSFCSALPLFVSEPPLTKNVSAYSSDSSATSKFPRTGGSYFSLGQWQELELQALIFRHMIAGAPVPHELLHLVKKSLFSSPSSSYFFPHNLTHFHPASLMQAGYWGRATMDPEPGRCRRTDGKKWRCSRDVVAGQKYCERHMHRGRNRSRKPVELPPTPNSAAAATGGVATRFTLSPAPAPSFDLLQLNQRQSEKSIESNGPLQAQTEAQTQTLRHFFDDWPKPLQHTPTTAGGGAAAATAAHSAGNLSTSLKLSTGDDGSTGWGVNQVGPMGGPLAEALRSSSTTTHSSSPTSVLH